MFLNVLVEVNMCLYVIFSTFFSRLSIFEIASFPKVQQQIEDFPGFLK